MLISLMICFACWGCSPKIIKQVDYLPPQPIPVTFFTEPEPCPATIKTYGDLVEYVKCLQGQIELYQLQLLAIQAWEQKVNPVP